jgi:hypothetical protein
VSLWGDRAVGLLADALDQALSGEDALPAVSAAEAALRIEAGELDPAKLDGYPFPDEDECTCPPGMVARGGFRSTCAVHGAWPS